MDAGAVITFASGQNGTTDWFYCFKLLEEYLALQ